MFQPLSPLKGSSMRWSCLVSPPLWVTALALPLYPFSLNGHITFWLGVLMEPKTPVRFRVAHHHFGDRTLDTLVQWAHSYDSLWQEHSDYLYPERRHPIMQANGVGKIAASFSKRMGNSTPTSISFSQQGSRLRKFNTNQLDWCQIYNYEPCCKVTGQW